MTIGGDHWIVDQSGYNHGMYTLDAEDVQGWREQGFKVIPNGRQDEDND